MKSSAIGILMELSSELPRIRIRDIAQPERMSNSVYDCTFAHLTLHNCTWLHKWLHFTHGPVGHRCNTEILHASPTLVITLRADSYLSVLHNCILGGYIGGFKPRGSVCSTTLNCHSDTTDVLYIARLDVSWMQLVIWVKVATTSPGGPPEVGVWVWVEPWFLGKRRRS